MSQPSHPQTERVNACPSPISNSSATPRAPPDSSAANLNGEPPRNTPIPGNGSSRPPETIRRLTWSPPWRPKPAKTLQETPHSAEPILNPNDPRVLAHQELLESLSAGVRTTRLMLDNFPNRGITDSDTAWIVHNDANYKGDALSGSTEQPAALRGSDAAPETHNSTARGGKPQNERTSVRTGNSMSSNDDSKAL